MNYCMITFRSVTPAQRAEGLLRKAGYECNLRRTPRWMEEQGCGYSLRLHRQDAQIAVQLLRSHQIPYRKVYWWRDGKAEELTL